MTAFRPFLTACLERGCHYMAGDKKRTVCLIGDKVLEDLSECPYDAAVKRWNLISPKNPVRNFRVLEFANFLTHLEGWGSEEERVNCQEVISCIVKLAKKAGFEIPEADE